MVVERGTSSELIWRAREPRDAGNQPGYRDGIRTPTLGIEAFLEFQGTHAIVVKVVLASLANRSKLHCIIFERTDAAGLSVFTEHPTFPLRVDSGKEDLCCDSTPSDLRALKLCAFIGTHASQIDPG